MKEKKGQNSMTDRRKLRLFVEIFSPKPQPHQANTIVVCHDT